MRYCPVCETLSWSTQGNCHCCDVYPHSQETQAIVTERNYRLNAPAAVYAFSLGLVAFVFTGGAVALGVAMLCAIIVAVVGIQYLVNTLKRH